MEGKPLIYERIAAIMKEVSSIGKTKKNVQQGFMYRGIDDVYNALQPLLAKHEVFTIPEVLEDKSEERQSKSGGTLLYRILKIKYTFHTVDGSSVYGIVVGEGMDSGDKASNKAMAIAHKYIMFQIFCIPTEEIKDPDSETHEVKPKIPEVKKSKEAKPLNLAQAKKIIEIAANFDSKDGSTTELSPDQAKEVIDWYSKNNDHGGRTYEAGQALIHGFPTIFDRFLEAREQAEG